MFFAFFGSARNFLALGGREDQHAFQALGAGLRDVEGVEINLQLVAFEFFALRESGLDLFGRFSGRGELTERLGGGVKVEAVKFGNSLHMAPVLAYPPSDLNC